MRDLSYEKYTQKLEKIKWKNTQKEYRMKLAQERNKYPLFKFETSKIFAVYLFALMNAIIVYAMFAMWRSMDFTYLGVLISDIAAQVLIYAIYCLKAYKAKKSEEEMRYKRECHDGDLESMLAAGADCEETVPVKGDVTFYAYEDSGDGGAVG